MYCLALTLRIVKRTVFVALLLVGGTMTPLAFLAANRNRP